MRENWRAVGGSTALKNHKTINTVIMQMNNLKRLTNINVWSYVDFII